MAQRMPKYLRDAVIAGMREILDQCGTQTAAAEAAKEKGIKLDQRTFSDVLGEKPKIGIAVAERVAQFFGTTLEGLVRKYSDEKGKPVRVSDVPGWDDAVKAAKLRNPKLAEVMPWELAGLIEMPVIPDGATPEFALDVATLLARYTEATAVRRRPKKVG